MARKRRTDRPYRSREPIPALEEAVIAALMTLTGPAREPATALEVATEIRAQHPRQRGRGVPTARDVEIVRRTCLQLVANGQAEECAERPVSTGRRPRMFCIIVPLPPTTSTSG